MSAVDLIERAQAAGVILWHEGGRIRYRGPQSAVDAILPALREYKPEILSLLSDLTTINRWLNSIEERDQAIREHILRQCRIDPGARAYFLRHAAGEFLH